MKTYSRILTLLLAVGLLICSVPVSAEEQSSLEQDYSAIDYYSGMTYSDYYDKYRDTIRPENDIKLDSLDIVSIQNIKIEEKDDSHQNAVYFTQDEGFVEFNAQVPEGIYHLEITYIAEQNNHSELEVSVMIDGEYPFDDSQAISLSRVWMDSTTIKQDENDNDILPIQQETNFWRSEKLINKQGFYKEPYIFYFSGGMHKIRITSGQTNIILAGIRLCNDPDPQSYSEYRSTITSKEKGKRVFHEAEQTYIKSDSTLYPTIDRSSSKSSPADPVKLKYNTIGQSNFSHVGEWITWKVDVDKSGNYNISFRAKQNIARGINSIRSIYIDDEMLFNELGNVSFPYSSKFYYKTLGDDKPFDIYLEEGEHTIRMEVVSPEVSEVMRVVNDTVYDLNMIYRQLMMLVGPEPDMFRDYNVEKEISDLEDRMARISNTLKKQQKKLEQISKNKGGVAKDIQPMHVMLDSMLDKPETIPYRMSSFQSNVSSVSAWISSVSAQPLELDYILLTPAGETLEKAEGTFFDNLLFGIKSVIGSYFEDYSSLGGSNKKGSINVWVGLGRDQAQVIKMMTDSYFTPESGVKVNLSLVQGSILEATLAG
ncbi:MAG: hypothetical protein PHP68_01260, partial [Oscillospiraceae bacterium]|nr:hypothetical protein [Oscillospiraceae bacterium]